MYRRLRDRVTIPALLVLVGLALILIGLALMLVSSGTQPAGAKTESQPLWNAGFAVMVVGLALFSGILIIGTIVTLIRGVWANVAQGARRAKNRE